MSSLNVATDSNGSTFYRYVQNCALLTVIPRIQRGQVAFVAFRMNVLTEMLSLKFGYIFQICIFWLFDNIQSVDKDKLQSELSWVMSSLNVAEFPFKDHIAVLLIISIF